MIATAPVFDFGHLHPLDAITGYDVVVSSWNDDLSQITLRVVAVVDGARNYAAALELARPHQHVPQHTYGYVTDRFGCGCRWIATHLRPVGATVRFLDLDTDLERD